MVKKYNWLNIVVWTGIAIMGVLWTIGLGVMAFSFFQYIHIERLFGL